MSAPGAEQLDAVVIGANIRGLVTTYVLSSLGYRAILVEKAPTVGGADASFVTPGGARFEFGMHVLDYMRSEVATRLFTHVVGGRVNRIALRRAIVLRNQIMPYAPRPDQMPPELRKLLASDDLIDDVGDDLPTRERLARCYGREFADLILDEVLPSYPCENRHRQFGVDEARLLTNIYPWLFPRARRGRPLSGESRTFHEKLRAGVEQQILYPQEGGFGGFAEGFLRCFDADRIEVLTNAGELKLELEPGTHTVRCLGAGDRRFRATHYFWAASWPQLCGILGIPCQDPATDRILLGSFRLSRPAITDYHEILVGDPSHRINRVYFPALFRGSDEALMQVEYAFPRLEDRSTDPDWWREAWLEDARRLGILDSRHEVEEFDFKSVAMHFNGFGMEGEPLRDADPSLLRSDSNIRPVVPSMANLNLNAHVPRTIRFVTSVLAQST